MNPKKIIVFQGMRLVVPDLPPSNKGYELHLKCKKTLDELDRINKIRIERKYSKKADKADGLDLEVKRLSDELNLHEEEIKKLQRRCSSCDTFDNNTFLDEGVKRCRGCRRVR